MAGRYPLSECPNHDLCSTPSLECNQSLIEFLADENIFIWCYQPVWQRGTQRSPALLHYHRSSPQLLGNPSWRRNIAGNRTHPSTPYSMRLVRNIRCNLLFFIICWGAASHGILQSGEKDALAELLLTFPRLSSIPTSEFVVDNHVDYGRSWTNNFDSLCLGSDGYEYYGLFCSGGHIAGIMLYVSFE